MTKQEKLGNIRLRALLPIVIIFILTLGLIIFSTHTFFDNQQYQASLNTTQRAQHRFEQQIQHNILDVSGVLQLIDNSPELTSAWKRKNRKSLLQATQPIFENINTRFDISHFYFHTLDGKTFLRAHRPGRFGDNINRKTLLTARRTGQTSAGLEIGTFGQLVVRVVQPWVINEEIVGYLELGKEIKHITEDLKIITGAEIITLIDKQLINKNDWPKVSGEKFHWQHLDEWVIAASTLTSIPDKLLFQPNSPAKIFTDNNNNIYTTLYFPVSNFSNTTVGHIGVIHNLTANDQQLHDLLIKIFIAGLVIISILSIAYFIYLGNIETRLAQTNLRLYKKIGEHKKSENNLKLKHDELSTINRELESYSYSIAHDLRSPLRSIISFSQIIQEDATERLTNEDKTNLQRVISAGKRMTGLIDDILQLSRITRDELSAKTINLSMIAKLIKQQLSNSNPERSIKWDIQADMFAQADPHLLERVIENLFDNAWKYTRYTDNAEISFGSVQKQNETIYFVRDNGAGFDMNYAHKLFATFQRLHNPREFSGSGVGLAIVLRVIQRHHGRIWGEGEVNKGATFYFTLPDASKT